MPDPDVLRQAAERAAAALPGALGIWVGEELARVSRARAFMQPGSEGPAGELWNDRAAAVLALPVPGEQREPELVTVEGTAFQGCTDNNADLCACETWQPLECDACGEEISDGERMWMLTEPALPWLPPLGHPDQDSTTFQWHERCDERRKPC